MKILFVGGTFGNSGPEQVNKDLVSCFDEEFATLRTNNKLIEIYDTIVKTLSSDVIVISGLSGQGIRCAKIGRIFKKPIVFLMHGCVEYEAGINGFNNAGKAIAIEKALLKKADLILCVSEKFSEWVKDRYTEYSYKIDYLNNGIKKILNSQCSNEKVNASKRIIAIGGNRLIKNNIPISSAVVGMPNVKFDVYGKVYPDLPVAENDNTCYRGEVSQTELHNEMINSDLFVLNSVFETFSLAVAEAINCNCSVLVSSKAGITGVLSLEETDIINDPQDVNEIRSKIVYLLDNPNNERIAQSLDYNSLSYDMEVKRLKDKCRTIIKLKKREDLFKNSKDNT